MEINLNQPNAQQNIRAQIIAETTSQLSKFLPKLTSEQIEKLVDKTNPWLACPNQNKQPVPPHTCMFCPFGHMTECHFPHTCNSEHCHHYHEV